jgi:RNA polymerase sigma factor (sigma-70 family)
MEPARASPAGEGPLTDSPEASRGRPNLESTALLLERARSGDEAARERLFARFLPILTRWAHRRLPVRARGLADTDDLVQITLIRALNRIGTFEPRREGAFLAYLRTILLNAVREQLRRSLRMPEHEALDEDSGRPEPSEFERWVGREKLELYERGLANLPEDQREAVLLRVEFGYSHQQIADALGKPSANAARMAVARALVVLARAIDDGPER